MNQDDETCPELERVLQDEEKPHSMPPPDVEPLPCGAHGSPLVSITMKHDAEGEPLGNWKVFEDGCEEPL